MNHSSLLDFIVCPVRGAFVLWISQTLTRGEIAGDGARKLCAVKMGSTALFFLK